MGQELVDCGIDLVRKHAKLQNWAVEGVCTENGVVCLRRGKITAIAQFGKIGKLSIATCLDHPYLGKTVLYREGIYFPTLKKILQDPRTHTGKGKHKPINLFQTIWEKTTNQKFQ